MPHRPCVALRYDLYFGREKANDCAPQIVARLSVIRKPDPNELSPALLRFADDHRVLLMRDVPPAD